MWMTWLALGCTGAGIDDTSPIDFDGDGSPESEDCDDHNSYVYPDAPDGCDGVDRNCNGLVDEDAPDLVASCQDADHDGHGDVNTTVSTCEIPKGYTQVCDDCDDTRPTVSPTGMEVCDGIDNNCDGLTDAEDPDVTGTIVEYRDADGDGYGAGHPVTFCPPADEGYTGAIGDCNDSDPEIRPNAIEVCDGVDNDCDNRTADVDMIAVSGGDSYTSFKSALMYSDAGDTLTLCPGAYDTEGTPITKDLTLISLSGNPNTTTLVGDGTTPTLPVRGATVSVTGVTITGGHNENGDGLGGGIAAGEATGLFLTDCIITGNFANLGGGLTGPSNGNLEMVDTEVSGNTSLVAGAGIHMFGGSFFGVSIHDNLPSDDSALFVGGGVSITPGSSDASVSFDADSEIYDNVAWCGGGLYLGSGVRISGGTWHDNTADAGAGACLRIGTFELTDMTFTDNHQAGSASYGGGGLALYSSDTTLDGCVVENNDAVGFGGGAYLYDTSLLISGGSVTGNTGSAGGGAVAIGLDSQLSVVSANLGSGATENAPDDIYVTADAYTRSGLGANSNVECSDSTGTCTP